MHNNSVGSSSDRSFYSSRKKPAQRESRRPNGHKVQLALNSQLQHSQAQLEKLVRKLQKSELALGRAEEQLLAQAVRLRSYESALDQDEAFLATAEGRLKLSPRGRSREDRQSAVLDALSSPRRRR